MNIEPVSKETERLVENKKPSFKERKISLNGKFKKYFTDVNGKIND